MALPKFRPAQSSRGLCSARYEAPAVEYASRDFHSRKEIRRGRQNPGRSRQERFREVSATPGGLTRPPHLSRNRSTTPSRENLRVLTTARTKYLRCRRRRIASQ